MKTQRSKTIKIVTLLCVVVFGIVTAQSDPGILKIVDPVTDLTNTLNKIEYTKLRKQIIQFEDSTSNQLVVLMVPTLGEKEIRDYGISLLENNKIGQQGKDNGILLLIAKDDHKISIEVGYGLEGVLTDALSYQIIEDDIKPQFRKDKYYEGIAAAIQSITLVTKGEYMADKKNKKRKGSDWFGILIIFIVILFSAIGGFRRRRYGITSRGSNNIWWGGGGFGTGGGFGSFTGGGGGGGWSAGGGSFGGGGASGSW